MMQVDKDTQVLAHIFKYCDKIMDTIDRFGNDFSIFLEDSDYRDSVGMNILQVGELSSRLSGDFVEQNDTIPWREIKLMRNWFAHDYGGMNVETIWKTAVEDIPELRNFCLPYHRLVEQAVSEIQEDEEQNNNNGMQMSL